MARSGPEVAAMLLGALANEQRELAALRPRGLPAHLVVEITAYGGRLSSIFSDANLRLPSVTAKVKSSTTVLKEQWVMGFKMTNVETPGVTTQRRCLGIGYLDPMDATKIEICACVETGGLIETRGEHENLFTPGSIWICDDAVRIRIGFPKVDLQEFRPDKIRESLTLQLREDVRKQVQMHTSRRPRWITNAGPGHDERRNEQTPEPQPNAGNADAAKVFAPLLLGILSPQIISAPFQTWPPVQGSPLRVAGPAFARPNQPEQKAKEGEDDAKAPDEAQPPIEDEPTSQNEDEPTSQNGDEPTSQNEPTSEYPAEPPSQGRRLSESSEPLEETFGEILRGSSPESEVDRNETLGEESARVLPWEPTESFGAQYD